MGRPDDHTQPSDPRGSPRAPATWSVVATVRESPDLTVFFAAYHLLAGAQEVFVFLDDPEDPVADALERLEGCRVIRCDAAYWRSETGKRPKSHQARQGINATRAYRLTGADWIAHIDADEYVHGGAALAGELAGLGAEVDSVRLPVAERIHLGKIAGGDIFAGAFRVPAAITTGAAPSVLPTARLPKHLRHARKAKRGTPGLSRSVALRRYVFGTAVGDKYDGLSGHRIGKSLTRTGRDYFVSLHSARVGRGGAWVEAVTSSSAALLHFEGLTPLHWAFKRVRPALGIGTVARDKITEKRAFQEAEIAGAASPGARALELYAQYHVADAALEERMRQANLLFDADFPTEQVVAFAAAHHLDLSPERFDRWLWDSHGAALDRAGFQALAS